MVSIDGTVAGSRGPGDGHPQDAGTYPKILGRFVREQNALSLSKRRKPGMAAGL